MAVWLHDSIWDLGGIWVQRDGQLQWTPISFTTANLIYRDFALAGAKHRGHVAWAWLAWAGLQFSGVAYLKWFWYRLKQEA